MKTLIDSVQTFLTTDLVSASAKIVEKGLPEDPQQIPFSQYPYIALGDGGERTEQNDTESQNRFFTIIMVFAVWAPNKETALDNILDLSNSVQASIEKEANRKVDGLIFGRNITPFDWQDEQGFYMGRTISIDYIELQDIYFNY